MQVADFMRYTLSGIISIAPTIALLLAGIYMLEKKILTQAGWIIFYVYANNLMYFFTSKVDLWIDVKEYQGRMNRLSELFAAPEEGVNSYIEQEFMSFAEEDMKSGDIVFDNVSFSYNDKPILNHANFTMPEKEFTAILGPSGTGKTTILKLIERIYDLEEGNILLAGRSVKDYGLQQLRTRMAYVKQDTPLISGTIRDNILYGVDDVLTDEQIMYAAKEVRADEFINHCPGRLDFEVGQFGNKLSGGQKQKISILRAFLQNREIILLDEPTASFDVRGVYEVLESIRELIGKRKIIMVAHEYQLVYMSSHDIVLKDVFNFYDNLNEDLINLSAMFGQMVIAVEEEDGNHGER